MKRRTFMQTAGLGVVATGMMSRPAVAVTPRTVLKEDEPLALVTRPYLQAPSPTSMTVQWLVNKSDTLSWVEYGEGKNLDQQAKTGRFGLIDADDHVHKIALNNLKPDTKYSYRVVSQEITAFGAYEVLFGDTIQSDVYQFKTPKADQETVNFLVFNDIHQDYRMFEKLLDIGGKKYDLALLNGDMMNHIDHEVQLVRSLLSPLSRMFASETPYVYVRGNHDARGRFARQLHEYAAGPAGRDYFYSFDYGPVHFLVMDLGEDKPDNNQEYSGLVDFRPYREAQRDWLAREIETDAFKTAPFRVLVTHIPLFGDGYTERQCKRLWGDFLNQGNIDLHLAGHWHRYKVIPAGKDLLNCPIVVGGGPKAGQATVMRVEANRKKLKLVMTRDDGKVVGELELKA